MTHTGQCGPFGEGEAFAKSMCRTCWNVGRRPEYAAINAGATKPAECPHRGPPTGEQVPCESCSGKVMLKVFACEKNGRCTLGRKVEGIALCEGS